jgi:nitronate monooxygenase
MSNLASLFGVDLPIVQAPMAGAQGSAMAIAVSNAGGLGSLPSAMLSVDALHSELLAIGAQSEKSVNVNFFCHAPPVADPAREAAWRALLAPYYDELGLDIEAPTPTPVRAPFGPEFLAVLREHAPRVVSFHFGLPSDELLSAVRALGPKIIACATTVAEARWLADRKVDAIVAQGAEAGGHRGMFLSDDVTTQVGTLALVRQVVKTVAVPVIAAGGIADAHGVEAALALGAVGVQIGTAYLLCPEATTSPVHRQALQGDAARHTALTNLFSGRPARSIVNRLMRELGPLSSVAPPFPLASGAVMPLRAQAEKLGRDDFTPLWSGQDTSGCRALPAAQLTRELAGA